MKMRTLPSLLMAGVFASSLVLAGCGKSDNSQSAPTQSQDREQVYNGQDINYADQQAAAPVERDSKQPRINLDQVKAALADIQEKDPDTWLQAFEQKVNEIHKAYEPDSEEVISIKADPDDQQRLHILAYISAAGNGAAYDPTKDTKVFEIVQSSTPTDENAQIQYDMTGYSYGGDVIVVAPGYYNPGMSYWVYRSIVHSLLWHGYYTNPYRYGYMYNYRRTFRSSPGFATYRAGSTAYAGRSWGGSRMTVAPVSPAARAAARPLAARPAAPLGGARPAMAPAPAAQPNTSRSFGTQAAPRVTAPAAPRAAPTTVWKPSSAPSRSFGSSGGSRSFGSSSRGRR